ncbi:MAG: UDP-N-acetylmuramate dehydrogenase [Candidatus Omnitrophica bacterium]|nr:UDP-N-acetylmuramate dehydrogenase [Candidatus Omnitrophota bacterium]
MNRDVITDLKGSVKGKIRFKERLSGHTSFRICGPADIWVETRDIKDLAKILLFAKRHNTRVFVVGGGTNILAGDSGFKGMVIHLGSPIFKKVDIKGTLLKVGAGFNVSRLVRLCCEKGLEGLESLIGIPGSVGGAVFMNAGGSANPVFKNIGDHIVSLKVMDYSGKAKILKKKDLRFGYRRSNLSSYVILEATLRLKKQKSFVLNSRCANFLSMKRNKQSLDMPSAGCVFKNPKDSQFSCGQMIDMLGLKGTVSGGAQISEKHANFIVNRDRASSGDVLQLIGIIKKRVLQNYNIPLELEIKII